MNKQIFILRTSQSSTMSHEDWIVIFAVFFLTWKVCFRRQRLVNDQAVTISVIDRTNLAYRFPLTHGLFSSFYVWECARRQVRQWAKNCQHRRRVVEMLLSADLHRFNPLGHHHNAATPDWRYTIRTISIEDRTLTIDKDQYRFGKELGAGAFGSVYAAQRVADSNLPKTLFFHVCSSWFSRSTRSSEGRLVGLVE